MKKQSGFTLIELMVVMAIIAILATAGLSAYTGYIQKARDTTRMADLAAINTIILGAMASSGLPPATVGSDYTETGATLTAAIGLANNGKAIKDPISGKSTCRTTTSAATSACDYFYKVCDKGTGYALATRFESTSNVALYASNTAWAGVIENTDFVAGTMYTLGNCTVSDNSTGATQSFAAIPSS